MILSGYDAYKVMAGHDSAGMHRPGGCQNGVKGSVMVVAAAVRHCETPPTASKRATSAFGDQLSVFAQS